MKNPIAYFESVTRRKAGRLTVIRYYCLRDDGSIKTIDVTRKSVKTNASFGCQPTKIKTSTAARFDSALAEVLKT